MKKRIIASACVAVMIAACILMSQGCATTPAGKAYDVLYSAAMTYDAAMSYAGDEYRAGRISEAQKDRIIKLAWKYKLAVKSGKEALKTYKLAQLRKDEAEMSKAEAALATALDLVEGAQDVLALYIQSCAKQSEIRWQPKVNQS
ncbi:MAG: hypothetical protein JRI34_05625 [Deltaproteobacteria bacterium]|nr:hypothetical protein [Deltaproteobacteria bacterium]